MRWLPKWPRSMGLVLMGTTWVLACLVASCGGSNSSSSPPTTRARSTTTSTSTTTSSTTTSSTTTSTSTTTTTTTVPASKFKTFGDGTYTVGQTVEPGTYRTRASSGGGCYWERLSGFSGETDDVIANNYTDDPSVVTIAPTDKGFRTSGCGTWSSNLSQITTSKTSFPSGTYIVNTDIEPGTYTAPGGDTCYWARLSGFEGTIDDIIANNFSSGGSVTVTIASTDKGFQSSGCGTFTKT